MRPLLVLRPEPGATHTATAARALGLETVIVPLFAPRALPWKAPDPSRYDAVMMTSANAARLGGPALAAFTHLPLYAVGEATARAAHDAGFGTCTAGTNDAAALARQIAADGRMRVLHLAGAERTALTAAVSIEVVTVYAVEALDVALPVGAAVALVHSPRAGCRLSALCHDPGAIDIVAISTAAAAASGTGWRSVTVAPSPRDAAMLALAAPLCKEAA